MLALTVRQPWASLIAAGAKDVENRWWPTEHRGALAIHAGKVIDIAAVRHFARLIDVLQRGGALPAELPLSSVIAVVDVVDCVRDSASEWAAHGQWHWQLANARPLATPVAARGQQRLWDWRRE